jgi:hypothetical protein
LKKKTTVNKNVTTAFQLQLNVVKFLENGYPHHHSIA